MTDQKIMQLVEEAGLFALIGPSSHLLHHEIACLQRFANLVAEREREALKSICEELEQHYSDYAVTALLNGDVDLSNAASGEPRACRAIIDAIRARGEKETNHD